VNNEAVEVENSDKEALDSLNADINTLEVVNKRIDFNSRTMRRLETMLPLYSHEIGKCTQSELLSYVVDKAVNSLFETDFKKKIEEL
jgi:hypothetical protein